MTHINAYYEDVQTKQAAYDNAKAALSQAESELKAHPDYKAPEKEEAESEAPKKKAPTKKAVEVPDVGKPAAKAK